METSHLPGYHTLTLRNGASQEFTETITREEESGEDVLNFGSQSSPPGQVFRWQSHLNASSRLVGWPKLYDLHSRLFVLRFRIGRRGFRSLVHDEQEMEATQLNLQQQAHRLQTLDFVLTVTSMEGNSE